VNDNAPVIRNGGSTLATLNEDVGQVRNALLAHIDTRILRLSSIMFEAYICMLISANIRVAQDRYM
jgi:hypothetical protein